MSCSDMHALPTLAAADLHTVSRNQWSAALPSVNHRHARPTNLEEALPGVSATVSLMRRLDWSLWCARST